MKIKNESIAVTETRKLSNLHKSIYLQCFCNVPNITWVLGHRPSVLVSWVSFIINDPRGDS